MKESASLQTNITTQLGSEATLIKSSSAPINPAITVLVPICNVENYLAQCLDSLLNQTFTNFEVLCINDGSTDSSGTIIRHYLEKDPRFKAIEKPNTGYGSSMNLGIDTAQGEYIAILESDDFFEPDALEKLFCAAQENEAQVVKANYWFYWSKPKPKDNPIAVVKPTMANHLFCPCKEPDILLGMPSIWTCLYQRAFLKKEGIRFLETPGASFQDMSFDFKVWASAKRAYLLEDKILHYRQDNEQSSVNNPAKTFCVCNEFNEIFRFIENRNEEALLKQYAFRKQYDSYMWNYGRLSSDLRKEFLPKMVQDLQEGIHNGWYAPELFGSWQAQNLEFLIANPEKFSSWFPTRTTRLSKAKYYFRIGGPKAVLDALKR